MERKIIPASFDRIYIIDEIKQTSQLKLVNYLKQNIYKRKTITSRSDNRPAEKECNAQDKPIMTICNNGYLVWIRNKKVKELGFDTFTATLTTNSDVKAGSQRWRQERNRTHQRCPH